MTTEEACTEHFALSCSQLSLSVYLWIVCIPEWRCVFWNGFIHISIDAVAGTGYDFTGAWQDA